MSRLQEATKPILRPIIKGEITDFDLDPAQLKTLSAWATMFTMVVEFLSPLTGACTFAEREQFSVDQEPQNHWMMWMGLYEPKPDFPKPWNFYHYAWSLQEGPISADMPYKCQSQTTTFVVGSTVFHTYSTRKPALQVDPIMFAISAGIRPLWPIPPRGFHALKPMDTQRLISLAVAKRMLVMPDYPHIIGDEKHAVEFINSHKTNPLGLALKDLK